jgi:hypothetical protein
MRGYVTAVRVAAVVALFALPVLSLPDDAAAADRRYGTARPPSTRTNPQPVYVDPNPRPPPKDWDKQICRAYKGMGRPLEAKECLERLR